MDILQFATETNTLIRILLFGILGFLLSMLITPLYTTIAYRRKWWKKPRLAAHHAHEAHDEQAREVLKTQEEKERRLVPTMAGIIFVVAVCAITLAFNLSRTETWLPLAAFAGAAVAGLIDDIIAIRRSKSVTYSRKLRLVLTTVVALIGGWFFYYKLGVDSVHIPWASGDLFIGWLIIPLFVLVVVATASAVNISDGLDGLAGGLAATAFGVYTVIALLEGRFGIAGFCMTMVGVLLSYTWFNVYPARFFMGDVGSFALGTALGVVAMLTNTVLLLPIIGFVFVLEGGSSLLQALSKKLTGKKLFKITPIHRHFEALGWPETKVTMRFWVLGQVCAVAGLVVFLLGRYIS